MGRLSADRADEQKLTRPQVRAVNRRVTRVLGYETTLGPKPTVRRALDLLTRAGLSEDEARAFLDEARDYKRPERTT